LPGAAAYKETHLCADPANFARCWKELDSGVSTAKELMEEFPRARMPGALDPAESEVEWSTSREYTGSWGPELSAGDASLSASVSYTSRFVRTITVNTKLPLGFHYISRYRSARELPQQWAAKALP
jgi:hypothetical protein